MQNFEGKTIDHYQVLEPLGKGGMAIVYRAFDLRLNRHVAIKLIRTEAIPAEQHTQLIRRFEREAISMAKLSHPNIIPVHDYGEFEGVPYLVMDYLPGGTLKQYTGQPVDYRQAAALLVPVAEALAYAHTQGVIHRDVKPANILITQAGHVMLSDFGIAKLLEDQDATALTGTGSGVGTPQYMAPEQWKNQVSPRTDIYALGIILYELITGRKPYDADTPAAIAIMQATEPLPRPRLYVPSLPDEVEQVLVRALALNPEHRYASMQEFAAVLARLSTGSLAAAPRPAAPPQPKTARFPWGWAAAAGILLTVIAFVGVFWIISLLREPAGSAQVSPTRTSAAVATDSLEEPDPTDALEPTRAQASTPMPTVTRSHATEPLAPTATQQTLAIGSSFTREIDGMMMMYVPAGEFTMGNDATDPEAKAHEKPRHQVWLDAYWMDAYEVTNAMFSRFAQETGYLTSAEQQGYSYMYNAAGQWGAVDGVDWHHPMGSDTQAIDDRPVVHVNFYDATAYCEWAGARLPTEAEWEKAARGTDARLYPWGSDFSASAVQYNTTDGPASVYSHPEGQSPYGIHNLSGNVFEWTTDWYSASYYQDSPYENPQGPASGEWRVLRGGSWISPQKYVRTTHRDVSGPESMNYLLGFRCVMDAD